MPPLDDDTKTRIALRLLALRRSTRISTNIRKKKRGDEITLMKTVPNLQTRMPSVRPCADPSLNVIDKWI